MPLNVLCYLLTTIRLVAISTAHMICFS